MYCIIAKMENAGASSLQKEIRRGMVTRVDRDYNALQRPLGVNKKKLKIHIHHKCKNTNEHPHPWSVGNYQNRSPAMKILWPPIPPAAHLL